MATTSFPLPAPPFDNSYARLPERFYARTAPTPVASPELIRVNEPLARQLRLDPDALVTPAGVAMLVGNSIPDGADPLAMAYAGHQFGNWVPQLGDGRALLLGEVIDETGVRQDIQLKGAGRTPWSRGGDGRAWLGPVLREYVLSEAMHALGIPTTRALAAVTTGEPVIREAALPGAVLTRVARSHVRVGTFQYFAAREDHEALQALVDHVIERQYPELTDAPVKATALLDAVLTRQASLIARWQSVGFIHGVMNTDNSSVTGDTIDYGPCAFLDTYDPQKVFSSIDQMRRYSYENQPGIAQWNVANLAQCLLPLMDPDQDTALGIAQELVNAFPERYQDEWLGCLRAKLGLHTRRADDQSLATDLLTLMAEGQADFTLSFRALSHRVPGVEPQVAGKASTGTATGTRADGDSRTTGDSDAPLTDLFDAVEPITQWLARWRQRLDMEPGSASSIAELLLSVNPAVIPRNHQVEAMIVAAAEHGDYAPFNAMVDALARPFEETPENEFLRQAPRPEEEVQHTFCGT